MHVPISVVPKRLRQIAIEILKDPSRDLDCCADKLLWGAYQRGAFRDVPLAQAAVDHCRARFLRETDHCGGETGGILWCGLTHFFLDFWGPVALPGFVPSCQMDFHDDPAPSVSFALRELAKQVEESISQLSGHRASKGRGQRDKEKGQKKSRPPRALNDRARNCLSAFNRRADGGQVISMAQHCREFCKEADDSESVYRTLKDWSHLWHKPKNGDKKGDNEV